LIKERGWPDLNATTDAKPTDMVTRDERNVMGDRTSLIKRR
jgi:hypothetical protein